MSTRKLTMVITMILSVLLPTGAGAQSVLPVSEAEVLSIQAEDLHRTYDFKSAAECFRKAISICKDSLKRVQMEALLSQSENGLNMTDFAYRPAVVARKRFPMQDFYLNFPLADKAWRPAPNQLDSLGGGWMAQAIYFPEGSRELYFSAPDTIGVRNICRTAFADTAWTAPAVLPFSSSDNEIYPIVQGDVMYFSSRGLYGMGGYDLYRSRRDPVSGAWSKPENLGFPYSSPDDDFLYMNTPDGRYTMFASNRGCPADSVNIYVLEYDSMPVRSAIDDPAELRRIAELDPVSSALGTGASAVPTDERLAKYVAKWREVARLKEEKAAALEMFVSKGDYATLQAVNARFDTANRELQDIEMECVLAGVTIDRSLLVEVPAAPATPEKKYDFTRKSKGDAINLKLCL